MKILYIILILSGESIKPNHYPKSYPMATQFMYKIPSECQEQIEYLVKREFYDDGELACGEVRYE